MGCCQRGHLEIATQLLAHGANLLLKNNRSCCALRLAVGRGHLEIVRLLLAHATTHGLRLENSALRRACGRGNVETVQALLNHGMCPFVRSRGAQGAGRSRGPQKTSFDHARDHPNVRRLLRLRVAVVVRTCVLGTPAEYSRRNRMHDLVPRIASYIVKVYTCYYYTSGLG